jgi:pyridoxamine 5'-phosphate oxidase
MNDILRNNIKHSKTLIGPFPNFDPKQVPEYPQELFLEWFQVALENDVHEPHAMTLSTTDELGYPDSRVLILKDIDDEGWYFASSSQSVKGRQIENNPNVALNFYWSLIGRQIRIRGKAIKMDKVLSAKDFLDRGTVARAIALLGKQSSILDEQCDFDEALTKEIINVKQNPQLVYTSWTLYKVVAKEVEFWQADEERKHIRLKYELKGEKWRINLLWA